MTANAGDELAALIKLHGAQQDTGFRAVMFGHVSIYDPELHRVRCFIPSLMGEGGIPVLTPWIQLGSAWVGSGFGFQAAPVGGATATNPTAGEQVTILIVDKTYGTMAVANLGWSDVQPPPAVALRAGEAILKHATGTYIKFSADGSMTLVTATDLTATINGNVTATVTGNLSGTVDGQATITVTGTAAIYASLIKLGANAVDSLMALCTNAMATLYNGHTHKVPNVASGPDIVESDVPDQQAGAGQLTQIVVAE